MAPTIFPISTVVVVDVSTPPTPVNEYNTSNLAIFTHEVPGGGFGSLGYKLYNSPSDVGTDFGTSSRTYKMAVSIFSQNPNILLPAGQLIVIPMDNDVAGVTAVQHIAFNAVPDSGAWKLGTSGDPISFGYSDNAAALQAGLRGISGYGSITVAGDYTAGFDITFTGVDGPVDNLLVTDNSMQDVDGFDITPVVTTTTVGVADGSAETFGNAIARTHGLIQYFGAMETATVTEQTQANVLAAAGYAQTLPLMLFFVSYDPNDIAPGGTLDLIRTGSLTQSRALYYQDDTSSGINAMIFMAGYAGRALSVDFTGSLTTITMNLKVVNGSQPDPNIDLTNKTVAIAAGADVYVNIGGAPNNLCSGKNDFFDNVYNTLWFSGAIQVAYFNYLAQTSTKILQTESGMTGLKSALTQVCNQAVANGFLAPGTWKSSTTFGNLTDFFANIAQYGFYIYSTPISQQSETDREDRKSPLIQIAIKFAGAIQSGTVIVTLNP